MLHFLVLLLKHPAALRYDVYKGAQLLAGECVDACMAVSGSVCTVFSRALYTPTRDTDALSRIRSIISPRLFEVW